MADINGDGILDFVYVDSDHRWTAINGSTKRTDDMPNFAPGHTVPGWPCWGRYFFADFTGDGTADRAYLSQNGKWHVINGASGAGGVEGIPWGSKVPGWPGNGRICVNDFDGCGRAERCYLHTDGSWYVVNNYGAPGIPGIPWGSQIPGWPGDGHYFIGDFNGNGAADRLYLSPEGGWYVVDSKTGAGGMPNLPWGHTIPGWPGGGRDACLDFNGDGIMDRCFIHPSGQVFIVDTPSGSPMQGVPQVGNWGDTPSDLGRLLLELLLFQASMLSCAKTLTWSSCLPLLAETLLLQMDLVDLVKKNKDREQTTIQQRDSFYTDRYNERSRGDDKRLSELDTSKSILSLRSAAPLTMVV